MATASPPSPPVSLFTILTESKRIINAHSRHFLALSVLFILPLSFSYTVYPSLHRLLLSPSHSTATLSLLRSSSSLQDHYATDKILLALAYYSFILILSNLAIGSITYSIVQGFYGRPVKLLSAIRSAFKSFFPILTTAMAMVILVIGIATILGFFIYLLNSACEVLGSGIEYSSPYFIAVCIIFMVIVMYLQLNWILAMVVVVVESTWGITPLKRSKELVKGMRSVSLSLALFFFLTRGLVEFWSISSDSVAGFNDISWWRSFSFVIQIVVTSAFLTLLSLYQYASITVFYMYCKAVHGELAWEIAEEFARDYVSLPFDDGKVPHLVSLAYNV